MIVDSLLNADFASATVLISFGAVLGVTTPLQLAVMAVCEIAVFASNEHLGLEILHVSVNRFVLKDQYSLFLYETKSIFSDVTRYFLYLTRFIHHTAQASDIGASMLVHVFGAYFGLAVSCVLRRDVSSDKEGAVYHSDVFAMIGMCNSAKFTYLSYC